MNVFKPDKQLTVIAALVEGNSIRSVERMTGVTETQSSGSLSAWTNTAKRSWPTIESRII